MTLKFARWFRKKGVSRRQLKKGKFYQIFGKQLLAPELWKMTRLSVARAWLISSISAASPFLGFHMIAGILGALIFRANMPLSIVLVWMNNPFTMFIYYPLAYWLGCKLLSIPFNPNIQWRSVLTDLNLFWDLFVKIWKPLLLGCTISGILLGVLGYILVLMFWKNETRRKNVKYGKFKIDDSKK